MAELAYATDSKSVAERHVGSSPTNPTRGLVMKYYLKLAVKIAKKGREDRNYKLGCVAIRKDGVIVAAHNAMAKRMPFYSAHAERRVIRKAGYGATLFVARILSNGDWAMAKPCPTCQVVLKARRVKRVIYTIGPGEYGVWEPC